MGALRKLRCEELHTRFDDLTAVLLEIEVF